MRLLTATVLLRDHADPARGSYLELVQAHTLWGLRRKARKLWRGSGYHSAYMSVGVEKMGRLP